MIVCCFRQYYYNYHHPSARLLFSSLIGKSIIGRVYTKITILKAIYDVVFIFYKHTNHIHQHKTLFGLIPFHNHNDDYSIRRIDRYNKVCLSYLIMDDPNNNYEDIHQNDNGIHQKKTMNSVSDETDSINNKNHNGMSDNNNNNKNNEDRETIKTINDTTIEYDASTNNGHIIDVENESKSDEIEVILNNKNHKKPKSAHNNNMDEDEVKNQEETIATSVDSGTVGDKNKNVTKTTDSISNVASSLTNQIKKIVNKKQNKIRPNYPYGLEILNRYSVSMSPPRSEGENETYLDDDVDSSDCLTLLLARGSVLDFKCPNEQNQVGAIINAANEGCLCGGGVDGAITDAGGPNLAKARLALPILNEQQLQQDDDDVISSSVTSTRSSNNNYSSSIGPKIRCYTGSAVLTGPDDFGEIKVPYVIHAVGPNYYNFAGNDKQRGHKLLYSAYIESLNVAYETNHITSVAFCLLSAGIFRASIPLPLILRIALMAIKDWRPPSSLASAVLIETKEKEADGTDTNMPSDSSGEDNDRKNIGDTVTTNDCKSSEGISNSTSASCDKRQLKEIIICAFTDNECNTLMKLCDQYFPPLTSPLESLGTTNEV